MKKSKKKYLTNPRKTDTIRISISYRSVPGKRGPEFVRSADLQSPPHKWHGFRILTHNPEVSRSNRLPATNENRSPHGCGFLLSEPAYADMFKPFKSRVLLEVMDGGAGNSHHKFYSTCFFACQRLGGRPMNRSNIFV